MKIVDKFIKDKEKIFSISLLFLSILFIILSIFLVSIKADNIYSKLSNQEQIIYFNVRGYYYNFNIKYQKNYDNLMSFIKSLNVEPNEILNIYPRMLNNYKIKGKFIRNSYSFFEWEIPYSFFYNFKCGEPFPNFSFRNDSSIYPGAPRYYRHGIHRGFDFSDREDGSIAGLNEPIKAVYPGIVVNIKNGYQLYSEKFKFEMYRKLTNENNYTDDIFLDFFRGNQVYIANENFLFIYAHLNKVNPDLKIGDKVDRGDIIGFMGNTGVEYMGTRPHLHLEIYINNVVFGINTFRRTYDHNIDLYKFIFSKY